MFVENSKNKIFLPRFKKTAKTYGYFSKLNGSNFKLLFFWSLLKKLCQLPFSEVTGFFLIIIF